MLSRRDARVAGSVLAGLAFVGAITLTISHEPERGAASPAELRDRLTAALAQRDADALAELVDYPVKGAGDFADSYVATLADRGVHDVAVTLGPDGHTAMVSGVTRDGGRFSYPVAVTSAKGRWVVGFTPPLP